MIGAGVFTTSGFALADLGGPSRVLAAWAVGGVIALAGALSYGALARRIPYSGGEYTFLSRTVHPLAGFLAGWVSLLAGFTAPIALAALGLGAYLAPAFGDGLPERWIGAAAILLAAGMHGLQRARGVLLQNVAVAAKLILIAGFALLGALRLPEAVAARPPVEAVPFDLGTFAVTLVWISFSYSGWNAAVYIGSEVRDPGRNLPRALALATLLVTALYLALNAVFVYSAPIGELAGKVNIGAVAAEALGGASLRVALSLLVALALFTSISAMVMAGPRVYVQMADDGMFPRWFAAHGRVPAAAVWLQAGLALVLVWLSGLSELLGYVSFTLGISAAMTVGGLMLLRRREGPERVPVPGYPWVPLGFIVPTLGAATFMAFRQPTQSMWGLFTVLAGVLLYALFARRRGGLIPRLPEE